MRQFQTSILERKTAIRDGYASEPFEAAWASEALYFLQVLNPPQPGASLTAYVQISPDGLHWVDEGARLGPLSEAGLYFVRVKRFGGWLRLRAELAGAPDGLEISLHLALKE